VSISHYFEILENLTILNGQLVDLGRRSRLLDDGELVARRVMRLKPKHLVLLGFGEGVDVIDGEVD